MDLLRDGDALSHELVIDWGVAQIPFPGRSVSGDRHLLNRRPDGLLIAVAEPDKDNPESATYLRPDERLRNRMRGGACEDGSEREGMRRLCIYLRRD